jgi:hypothetical protein
MTTATRYRFRLVAPAGITAALYGGGTYGATTYGQEQDETATAIEYTAIPVPAGTVNGPAWEYAVGDTYEDLVVDIVSTDGTDRFVDADVAQATLVLTRFTDGYTRSFQMTAFGNYWRRQWETGDLDAVGLYRVVVALLLTSGRRLTVPWDDRLTMKIGA